jgi:glycosyltransferase involved in cell wall biosynthesis
MARLPTVTVVIPTHDYGRYLAGCVMSVLGQPGVDLDVLIVDDASSDGTPAVTDALLAADDRIRVIRHRRNHGHIATFDEGLFAATGTYVVKLDADDLLPPGALARATDLLEACPHVGFVSGRPVHFAGAAPARRALRSTRVRSWTVWSGHDWVAARCRAGCNTISNPEVVMRTEVMRAAGGQKACVPHTSDFELWLQMAALADVGRVNGPPQGCYRVHAESMQRTIHAGVLADLVGLRDAYASAFAGAAGALHDAAELHAIARRRLAANALDLACRAYDRPSSRLPVDELVAFALDVWPDTPALSGWRALERRRRTSPAITRHRYLGRAISRRAAEEVNRWQWQRTGQR